MQHARSGESTILPDSPKMHLKSSHPFKIVRQIASLRLMRKDARLQQRIVGFVPTMGALHNGHLDLIRRAAQETDDIYVSVYVNPTQFGVNEDLNQYPRTWPSDQKQLEALQVEFRRGEARGTIAAIFMPDTKEMYPGSPPTSEVDGDGSFVIITPLSRRLEGASRPVFFRGVATVVMKLLNIVQPEKIYFGQKDVQQTYVIKQMVRDFHLDSQVIVCPTVRESDGLAMSSRNVYLGERRREVALVLLRSLKEVERLFARGERDRKYLLRGAMDVLTTLQKQQMASPQAQRARFEIDYVSIADYENLEELDHVTSEHGAIVSGAIRMLPMEQPQPGEVLGKGNDEGTVRLIDNLRLDLLSAKLNLSF